MQIQTEKRVVELDGLDHAQNTFKISQNKRMFEILSSNIYSDKVLAVVREYGCNAYDAHVAAGKEDVPFEVHLPNSFEPWFAVKDFGIGLSHDGVMELYSTYGLSTKTGENKSIGMLGLGSKSGFAYSDQFTVTSWFDGVERIYSAFVSEDGTPTITMLSEEETTEGNGLEIRIPVQSADFGTFAGKARTIFYRFPVMPIITGNVLELDTVKYHMTGPNYKIREENGQSYALQGVVAYPINVHAMNIDMSNDVRKILQNFPIDITFAIGELDITASREQLNYDKVTQANIVSAAQKVLDDLPNQFKTMLDGASTLWDAKVLFQRWFDNANYDLRKMQQLIGEKMLWKGQEIDRNAIHTDMYDYDPIDGVTTKAWGDCLVFDPKQFRSDVSKPTAGTVISPQVRADVDTLIVFHDKRLRAPIMSTVRMFGGHKGYLYLFNVPKDKEQAVLDSLGNPPASQVRRTSEMTEPPPVPKQATGVTKQVRTLYAVGHFNSGSAYLKETLHDVTAGGYYMVTYQQDPIVPFQEDKTNTSRGVFDMYRLVMDAGLWDLEKKPVFSFNSSHVKYATDNPLWLCVHTEMLPVIQKYLNNKKLLKAFSFFANLEITGYNKYISSDGEFITRAYDYLTKSDPNWTTVKSNSTFLKLKKLCVKYAEVVKDQTGKELSPSQLTKAARNFFQLADLAHKNLGISQVMKTREGVDTLAILIEDVKAAYPLLRDFSDHQGTKILHYVNLCDAAPKIAQLYKTK